MLNLSFKKSSVAPFSSNTDLTAYVKDVSIIEQIWQSDTHFLIKVNLGSYELGHLCKPGCFLMYLFVFSMKKVLQLLYLINLNNSVPPCRKDDIYFHYNKTEKLSGPLCVIWTDFVLINNELK